MKNLVFACMLVMAVCGCKKYPYDAEKYYPEVKMISATAQPDGSVLVRGQISSEGSEPVEYAGFCMDTLGAPKVLSNQKFTRDPGSSEFTATYENLNSLKTYYFRCFAVNSNGYTVSSNSVELSKAGIDTNSIPCHPPLNQVNLEGSLGTLSETVYVSPLPSSNPWQITAHANSFAIYIDFGKKPINGTYPIWDSGSPGLNSVSILVGSYYVESGTDVQVIQVSETVIDVWICGAKVYRSGEMKTLNLHLRTAP